jgi:oligopeptide transport system permease protein
MMEMETNKTNTNKLKEKRSTTVEPTPEKQMDNLDSLFRPAKKMEAELQQLSRPSLSYWEDAWIRLKKNKKAIASLYLVTAIIAFSVLGPYVWTIDPNKQNLNMISQGPSFGQEAVITSTAALGDVVIDPSIPEEPDVEVDELGKTSQIEVLGEPNTVGVHIKWTPVEGAWQYTIYRNENEPTSNQDLGIPLFTTEFANQLSYVDSLQLENIKYYYTVVATDGVDESAQYTTIAVEPKLAYSLEQAQAIDPDYKVGDSIKTSAHPFGTDQLGRDILARLMYGGQISFFIGFFAPLLYILIGTLYGGIAGFIGGAVDSWMMRFSDFVVALPFLLFMILSYIAFGAGPGESGIMPMLFTMVFLLWPATARLVRGQVLQLREEGFTQAAKLLGATSWYILLRHMIPNTIGVILVTLTFAIPSAIFTEAFLSFIGMGVAPPNSSWGIMSNEGIQTMLNTPHELIFPAIFISLTVLSFNLLGDGLRDALDARMRSRE